MDKKTLENYRHYRQECANLKYEIDMYRLENSVHDVTTGSQKEFPYIKRTSPVDGCPDDLNPDSHLSGLKRKLVWHQRIVRAVERFADSIEDPVVQKAIRIRYMDGSVKPEWTKVARKIGGNNSSDGIRKAVTRFLQKN